jgi:methionine salvage enolase-phosphatase E1
MSSVNSEFKTVTGNIRKITGNYKAAREKAGNVFLKIDAPLTRHAVTRRLSGVIRHKGYTSGVF